MKSFRSIEELLKILAREKKLLKEMFAKRKSLSNKSQRDSRSNKQTIQTNNRR